MIELIPLRNDALFTRKHFMRIVRHSTGFDIWVSSYYLGFMPVLSGHSGGRKIPCPTPA
jgi:hypothetical protein